MWPEPGTVAALLALGAWAAMDGTSVGQLLVSRPLFSATLAGWIVGAPAQGLVVGIVLEALHLGVLPVGASRYPESGPPAVIAGATYGWMAPAPGALVVAVAFALAWEWVGGRSVYHLRQLNRRTAALAGRSSLAPQELEKRHRTALVTDLLRGVLLTGAGLLLLPPLAAAASGLWGLDPQASRVVLAGAVAASLGASMRLFTGRASLFVAGAAIGLIFVVAV